MENLSKQKIELQKRLSSLKRPADQSIPLSDKGWLMAVRYLCIGSWSALHRLSDKYKI